MKKGHFDSKKGGNVLFLPKNWNQILRPAINEWRPKKHLHKNKTDSQSLMYQNLDFGTFNKTVNM